MKVDVAQVDHQQVIVAIADLYAAAADRGTDHAIREACTSLVAAVAFIENERGKQMARMVVSAALDTIDKS